MREIKFRAWDKHSELMVTWSDINQLDEDGLYPFLNMLEDDRHVVMQFTGLQDRNGKDIYDEDILKCDFPVEIMDNGCHSIDGETIIMRVSFIQGCWIAKGKAVNYEFLLPLDEINLYELFETKAYGKYPVKISVIGNTFENIELLEATV